MIKNIIQIIERPVIDISPSAPIPEPFYIGIKMESYEDHSWLHVQQCELIGEDGGFKEVIIRNGCSTNEFLYQLQGGQNRKSFSLINCFFKFKILDRLDPSEENFAILPFKPLNFTDSNGTVSPNYIWNVKCNYIACDDKDNEYCKLDDACAGRYDFIKSSSIVHGRKRRSGDGKIPTVETAAKIVEHPCAYADNHTSICDGNGENCWTKDVCWRTYNSSALSALSSSLTFVIFFLFK